MKITPKKRLWSNPKKYPIKAVGKCVELTLRLYSKSYSEKKLWSKLKKYAIKAGRKCVEFALQLYYAFQSPETPNWTKNAITQATSIHKIRVLKIPTKIVITAAPKTVIIGALGYFICPSDLILDFLPIVGFSDDTMVLSLAVGTVAGCITDEMKDKAKRKVDEWFGEEEEDNKGE